MTGRVDRDTQELPITTPITQGAGEVAGSNTALDGANQIPFVLLLDESNPARAVSPAGEDTLQGVLAALGSTTTASLSSYPVSTLPVQFLGSSPLRRGVQVVNDSSVATLYLGYAIPAGVSTTAYTAKVSPGAQWEMPGLPAIYTGPISGVWDSADAAGAARVTQIP